MIDLSHVSLQFGGRYLFRDIQYKIHSGDRVSLVGANGTGKTSLMKIITGELQPEEGKIHRQRGISVGYLPQDNVTHHGRTLIEEAESALSDIVKLRQKEELLTDELNDAELSDEDRDEIIEQLGDVHLLLESTGSYSASANVQKVLAGLGFIEADFDRNTETFSGGWQMRIALAKLLITRHDVLLLDEPTNHLDLQSLRWLVDYLRSYKGALLVVSHDLHFIRSVTNKTLEIYLTKVTPFDGAYDAYLLWKDERDAQLENIHAQQMQRIKEIERFVERFRYKSTKARQVQSRIKMLEKIELIELPDFKDDIKLKFPQAPFGGAVPIELRSIRKQYDSLVVFDKLTFSMQRGERVAFVGPNGAGKTTLAKIIADKTPFQAGERLYGHNTVIAYYAQESTETLNPDDEIIEAVDDVAINMTIGQLRSFLGSFLFSGEDVFKKISILSGGEKSRVALARILLTPSNLLILDEPTNHLDYDSKNILQQALKEYAGTIILVSHDIDFLRPLVNKVVHIERNSVKVFYGDIDYYLSKIDSAENEQQLKAKEKAAEAEKLNRKEEKRREAEYRQKRYRLTKDLVDKIKKLEQRIEQFETREKELEHALTTEEVYSNPMLAKQKNEEYLKTKEELRTLLHTWEDLNRQLDEKEKELD